MVKYINKSELRGHFKKQAFNAPKCTLPKRNVLINNNFIPIRLFNKPISYESKKKLNLN